MYCIYRIKEIQQIGAAALLSTWYLHTFQHHKFWIYIQSIFSFVSPPANQCTDPLGRNWNKQAVDDGGALKPLRGFNNVSSLLQLSVSTAVHACWILSCARVQGQPCHIFLFCASYSNAARENDRSHKKSGADESQSKVFACRNWECAALSFSNFLPCASGPERFVWACSYMGTTAAKVLRVLDPSQSAISILKWGAWRLRMPSPCTFWPC